MLNSTMVNSIILNLRKEFNNVKPWSNLTFVDIQYGSSILLFFDFLPDLFLKFLHSSLFEFILYFSFVHFVFSFWLFC